MDLQNLFFIKKNINWVLNVGNQIFYKSRYLKVLDRKNITIQYLEADAYAQSFFG